MLKINNQTYKLGPSNYIERHHSKTQIVIGNTFSENMNHFNGWKTRHGGKFKRTASFTIDLYGNIYQHYSPEYYSRFLEIKGVDEHIIPILIENEGWLTKDIETNEYINYVGNTYNRKEDVIEKCWKEQKYWAPYLEAQMNSAVKLSEYLCKMFGIPLEAVDTNVKFDGAYDFNGVVYKSNLNRHYNDVSPAWDSVEFKNKLELK